MDTNDKIAEAACVGFSTLLEDLMRLAEAERLTAQSETLAGNIAKAEWHSGKEAGITLALCIVRDRSSNDNQSSAT